MPPVLQGKLLHFLENRQFRRVGGVDEITVDVRVIAATNCDIEKAMAQGRFREDLMYRLNVLPIFLPPLSERGDDVHLLAQHFTSRFAREFKRPITKIDDAAYEMLSAYAWPGNVRELRNVVERAVILGKDDVIGTDDIVLGRVDRARGEGDITGLNLPPGGIDFAKLEHQILRQALERAGGNQTKAARLLNLSRDTFRYRLDKYGLL